MNVKIDNQYSSPFKVVNVDSKGSQSSGIQFKNSSQNQSLFQITSRLHTTSSKNQSLQLLNNYSFAEVKDSLDKAKSAIDTLLIDKLNLQNQLEYYECNQGNNYFDRFNTNQRTNTQSSGSVSMQAAQNYKINMTQLLNQHSVQNNLNNQQHQISPQAQRIQENLEQIINKFLQNRIHEPNKNNSGSIQLIAQEQLVTNGSNNSYQPLSELIDNLQKQNIQYRSQLNKQKDSEEKQQAMKKEINSLTSQLALLNLKMKSMQEQKINQEKNIKRKLRKKKNSRESFSNSDNSSQEDNSYSSEQSKSNSRSSSNSSSSYTSNNSKKKQSQKRILNMKLINQKESKSYIENIEESQNGDKSKDKKSKEEQKIERQKRNNKQLIQVFLKNVRMNKDQLFCFRQKFKNESEFYSQLDNKKYNYLFYKLLDYHNLIISEFQNKTNNHFKQNSIENAYNIILKQQSDSVFNKQDAKQYQIDNRHLLKQQIPFRHSTQFNTNSAKQFVQLHQKNKSNDSSNYPYTSRPVSSNITKNQYSFLGNNQSNNYSDIIQDFNFQSSNTPLESSMNAHLSNQNKGNQFFSRLTSQELPSLKQITPDVKEYTTMTSYENTNFNKNIQAIKSQLQTMTNPSHKQSIQSNGTIYNLNQIMDDFEYDESPERIKKPPQSYIKNSNISSNNKIDYISSQIHNNQNTDRSSKFQSKNNNSQTSLKPKLNGNSINHNDKYENNNSKNDNKNKILYYENYNIFEDRQNIKQPNQLQKQLQSFNEINKSQTQRSHLSKIYEEQLHLSQQQSESKQSCNQEKSKYDNQDFIIQQDSYRQSNTADKHLQHQDRENIKNRPYLLSTNEQSQDKQRHKELTPPQQKIINNAQPPERKSNSSEKTNSYSQSAKQKRTSRPPLNEDNSSKVNVPCLDLDSVEKWNQSGFDSSSNRNSKFTVIKEKQQKQNTQGKIKKQQSASDANTSDGCVTPQSQTNIPKLSQADNIYYVMPSLREKYLMRKSLQLSSKDDSKQVSGSHTETYQEKRIRNTNGHSNSNNSNFNTTSNKQKSGSTESNQFSEGRSIKDFSIANDVKKRIFENQGSEQLKQNSIILYQNNPNQY